MIYSVGEDIYGANSGAEMAQGQRTHALLKQGVHAKVVTRQFNQTLHANMRTLDLAEDDVINMYDYFQGTTTYVGDAVHVTNVAEFPIDKYHVFYRNNDNWDLDDDGRTIANIKIANKALQLVDTVAYLDRFNNVTMKRYYDIRGFVSMDETYQAGGEIANQVYYNLEGQPVLEVIYMPVGDEAGTQPTVWKLLNYKGFDYVFDFEDQLFIFFLNELNRNEQGIFIADRPSVGDAVKSINNPIGTIAYLHQGHSFNPSSKQVEVYPEYFNIIQPKFGKFDAIAVATPKQAQELQPLTAMQVIHLPTVAFPIAEKSVAITELKKLVYVGRLAADKNISGLIELMAYLVKKDPAIKLVLKGRFNADEYKAEIDGLIDNYKLADNIEFLNYNTDNTALFKDASMFVTTSYHEGFGMGALESLAHGVPVAAYGVDYLKDNVVQDGFNGVLTEKQTPQELGRKIVTAFKRPRYIETLQANALTTAKLFTPEKLGNDFKSLLG